MLLQLYSMKCWNDKIKVQQLYYNRTQDIKISTILQTIDKEGSAQPEHFSFSNVLGKLILRYKVQFDYNKHASDFSTVLLKRSAEHLIFVRWFSESPRRLCCYMTLVMKKTFLQVRLFLRSHIGVIVVCAADNAAIMLPPVISISLQPSVCLQLNPEMLWHQTWACGQISSCCCLSVHASDLFS